MWTLLQYAWLWRYNVIAIITLINDLLVNSGAQGLGLYISVSTSPACAHALSIQCSTLYCHSTALQIHACPYEATICMLNLQCHVQAPTSQANTDIQIIYTMSIFSVTVPVIHDTVLTCTPDEWRPPPIILNLRHCCFFCCWNITIISLQSCQKHELAWHDLKRSAYHYNHEFFLSFYLGFLII